MNLRQFNFFAIILSVFLLTSPVMASSDAHDEPRPYHSDRDASADVEAALLRAKVFNTRVILVMGANWCHDSRGLAARFALPEFEDFIMQNYELVYIDVGEVKRGARDKNIDIAQRFGIDEIVGTPTVLVLTADGVLLNKDTAPTWRNAASRTTDETMRYFESYVKPADAIPELVSTP